MLIVVSGTHASGKSTLISDFALRHPRFTALPDPFDLVDESWDRPSPALFARQLRIASDRLLVPELGADVIAERGPLDFLAYLVALDDLSRATISTELREGARALTAEAMRRVDLLVVLPLTAVGPVDVSAEEDPELRDAMNDALLDLVDDRELVPMRVSVLEVTGTPDDRLAALESRIRGFEAHGNG